MRNLITLAFVLVSFVVSGCFMSRLSPDDVAPMVDDTNPFVGGDAGPTEPDAGPTEVDLGSSIELDSGPIVEADAGSDAFVPPTEDAGADAGLIVEVDGGTPDIDSGPVDTDAGTVSDFRIEAFDMPSAAIVVAGVNQYAHNARYRVSSGETIDVVDVYLEGDSTDIMSIGIFDGDNHFYGFVNSIPRGENVTVRVVLSEPFVTPMDVSGVLVVDTASPAIVSSTMASGATVGWTRSGDTFRVGISGVDRRVGSAGIHVDLPVPIMSNEFVLRRAEPRFTNLTVPSSSVVNGINMVLGHTLGWAFASPSMDPVVPAQIAIRRIGMEVEINSADGTICGMGLRRDLTELIWGVDYVLSHGPGGVIDPAECWDSIEGRVVVYFVNEEILTNDGAHFYLHGTPSGFVAGDSIAVSFDQRGEYDIITGYLGRFGGWAGNDQNVDISPLGSPTPHIGYGANLIWSDLSEVPHIAEYGFDGGSRDWTNGYLVLGLDDLASTLTAL